MRIPKRQRAPRCSALGAPPLQQLRCLREPNPQRTSRRRSRERLAVGAAATLLGDTASVTRSSYIHPAWIDVGRSDPVVAAVAESSGSRRHACCSQPFYRSRGPGSGPFRNHRYALGSCGSGLRPWAIEFTSTHVVYASGPGDLALSPPYATTTSPIFKFRTPRSVHARPIHVMSRECGSVTTEAQPADDDARPSAGLDAELAALRGQVSQLRAENDRLLPFTVPD